MYKEAAPRERPRRSRGQPVIRGSGGGEAHPTYFPPPKPHPPLPQSRLEARGEEAQAHRTRIRLNRGERREAGVGGGGVPRTARTQVVRQKRRGGGRRIALTPSLPPPPRPRLPGKGRGKQNVGATVKGLFAPRGPAALTWKQLQVKPPAPPPPPSTPATSHVSPGTWPEAPPSSSSPRKYSPIGMETKRRRGSGPIRTTGPLGVTKETQHSPSSPFFNCVTPNNKDLNQSAMGHSASSKGQPINLAEWKRVGSGGGWWGREEREKTRKQM
ncbi:basic salivary proline-rich protein 2-like [Sarcophilus harrisii]|uniref:basic salivary proline-rich protein 2-like n=1 Tax=Sarcophilus harrisii TaxID=9305 RepID=UPI001302085B|nr:basic salivary proline-rich protein 2-like [Sarcophilus harrisii]